VTTAPEDLANEIAPLQAALLVERERRIAEQARAAQIEAELAIAKAKASEDEALIAHQRLQIEKLTRQLYGPRSERTARLIDQMELTFEEFESSATEDEIAAERAVAKTTNVVAFTRPGTAACREAGRRSSLLRWAPPRRLAFATRPAACSASRVTV
jgi:transposase